MKTVADFVRHKASLHVVCRNCEHEGYISAGLLRYRLGNYGQVSQAKFLCTRCNGKTVTLSAAAASTTQSAPHKMLHFGGVYDTPD
jgi:hypothetical protein